MKGLLWNATAFWGTTVQDVTFASNVTSSPPIMWTGAVLGGIEHRIAFIGNIGRGRPAGQFQIYGGDNVTVTNNKLLNGPPQASGCTANPPVFFFAEGVCGSQSGNTYWSGAAALPFRMGMLHQNGYTWPFPPARPGRGRDRRRQPCPRRRPPPRRPRGWWGCSCSGRGR